MGLETFVGTYINGLNPDNPVGATDPKSQGDDHIRGVKLVLQNQFPNLSGAVTSSHSELNILDGVTATATELNYLDIITLGTAQNSKAITVSAAGAVNMGSKTETNVNIDSGAIDGTTIGASSAVAGTFTTLSASTSIAIGGSTAMTGVEEGTLVGSATKLAGAGAAKAYIDSRLLYTETTPVSFTAENTTYNLVHGLGVKPWSVQVVLVASATPQGSYDEGDELHLDSINSAASEGDHNARWAWGVTTDAGGAYDINVSIWAQRLYPNGDSLYIPDKNGSWVNFNPAAWGSIKAYVIAVV